MKLIIETDIGHDPDDFFALCYFFSAGVDVKAILISPGDESQIAVVDFILKTLNKTDVLIGVPELGRKKEEPTNIHKALLDKYKFPYYSTNAQLSSQFLDKMLFENKDIEFFGCGPLKNFGAPCRLPGLMFLERATMQGGFIGYDVHGLSVPRLPKFEGKIKVPTFNLNGCKQGAINFLEMSIKDRRFVGKNVCHGVTYGPTVHEYVKSVPPKNRAAELLREGMDLRFKSNPEGKVFHDPTAAVCHVHPEIGTWVKAKPFREKGEWGATLNENGDSVLVDIDKEKLWKHIAEGV